MRPNRLSERLKTKLDSFGFDALIHGVSTLPEEKQDGETAARGDSPSTAGESRFEGATAEFNGATVADSPSIEEGRTVPAEPAALPMEEARPAFDVAAPLLSAPVLQAIDDLIEEPEPAAHLRSSSPHPFTPKLAAPPPDQLRSALDGLGCQLGQEAARLAAALNTYDVEEAGFHLSHLNQVLELLHSIDPRGDAARDLATVNAPPAGRLWPSTAWTVAEFAESPFSALLPSDCGDAFVRLMLYAAWGVSVEPLET